MKLCDCGGGMLGCMPGCDGVERERRVAKGAETPWMDARAFARYLEDEKLAVPYSAWSIVQIMRGFGTRKIVLEKGRPMPGSRAEARLGDLGVTSRPVVRYVLTKRVRWDRICEFRATVRTLRPGE